MTRVRPVDPKDAGPELRDAMERQRAQLGLVPQSLMTMALRPNIALAWAKLAGEVTGAGTVDRGLKQLVAYVASAAHGCRYCQAHTGQNAVRSGVDPAKLRHVFDYETSPLFDDGERAALCLAGDAALVPSKVTDEHFERLRAHFSDEQITEIVAVIAMFGWLNRWNDTMATTLEPSPLEWAEREIAMSGWEVGKHDDHDGGEENHGPHGEALSRRPVSRPSPLIPGRFELDEGGVPSLLASRCESCGRTAFPPRSVCPRCRRRSMLTRRLGSTAALYSFTVCHSAPAGWRAPYLQAYVELAEGIKVFALVSDEVEPTAEALTIGEPMELVIEPIRPGSDSLTYKYRPLAEAARAPGDA